MRPSKEVERFLQFLLRIYPAKWSDATIRFVLANATSAVGLEAYLDEVERRVSDLGPAAIPPTPPPSDVRLRRR